MKMTYTAVFEKHEDWYVGYIEEVPGANTQGRILEEARENLHEALEMVLEANRELSQGMLTGKDFIKEPMTISS